MTSPRDQDLLHNLEYVVDMSPMWGHAHSYAVNPQGEPFELLEAGERSEKINELMSWSKILSQISHPAVPPIAWSVFSEDNAKVCFRLTPATSLYDLIREARLTRIDALCTFYQVALALRELHARQLTFGHLNLQNIYVTPDGQAQLRGWVPASSHVAFEIRRVNDLKLFQNTFYRCIVGFPPPIPRQSRVQLSPERQEEEQRHQLAWEAWYQDEEARAASLQLPIVSQLHRSSLFMFDASPKSAEQLVSQLFPFTDHALSNLISLTSEQIAQRQVYQELFEEREGLIRKLDQVRKHLNDWVATHLNSFEECHEERVALEQLFSETHLLISVLEERGQSSFISAHDPRIIRHNASPTPQKGTAVYLPTNNAHSSFHHDDPQGSRGALDPERGLSLTNRYQVLAQSMGERVIPEDDSLSQLLSHLGVARHELNEVDPENPTRLFGNQATELFQRAQGAGSAHNDELADGKGEHDLRGSATQHDLQPTGDDYTIDRQLSESIFYHPDAPRADYTGELLPHSPQSPRASRPYRRIIGSLYLALFLFILWYALLEQGASPYQSNERAPTPSRELSQTQAEAGPNETAYGRKLGAKQVKDAELVAGEEELVKNGRSDEAPVATVAPPKIQTVSPKTDRSLRVNAPVGMTLIPGGKLRWGLSEESVVRMHQHCKFSPWFYKLRLKEGGEHVERICKASIRRDFKGIALVKDNSPPTRIEPFFIDRYEVSRAGYQEACDERVVVCPTLPTDRRYGRLPIAKVSYSDASDYCKWRGKRLPTESEWLFAARGEEQSLYPWGSTAIYSEGVYRANYRSLKRNRRERDGHEGPHNVRLSLPQGDSSFGVSHMGGNVREWVRSSGYRHPSAVLGPSWKSRVWLANLMQREAPEDLSWRAEDIGFRCAKDSQ